MFSILLFKQSVYAENKAKAVPENRGAGLEGRQLFCPGYETGGALIVQPWDKNKPWPWEVRALQPYKVTGGNPNSPDASTALNFFGTLNASIVFNLGILMNMSKRHASRRAL